jgi:hypothetical protein
MSRQRIAKIIILIVLMTPIWSFLFWLVKPMRPLDVFIMDKTVLFSKGDEHRSFNWMLTHQKYSKPNHKHYSTQNDYMGFFPIERGHSYFAIDLDSLSNFSIDSIAYYKDMVFYTDMYGIYVNEWFSDITLWKERSPSIYGGLSWKDLRLLQNMKAQQKLILAEFNYYHHPTPLEIRKPAGDLLNIEWTGWVGRYFDPLIPSVNEELPRWVVDNWLEQHGGGPWPFTKAGIAFAHEDNRVEILEIDRDLLVEIPYIYTSKYGQKEFNLIDKVHYPFWFDISVPSNDSNLIISSFRIEPNARGDSILKTHHIPRTFPALMKSTGPSPYFYFGADFSDNPLIFRSAYFAGSGVVDFLFYDQTLLRREKFFYTYYRPLLKKILRDYYKEIH